MNATRPDYQDPNVYLRLLARPCFVYRFLYPLSCSALFLYVSDLLDNRSMPEK
jgi:hypothetical protein